MKFCQLTYLALSCGFAIFLSTSPVQAQMGGGTSEIFRLDGSQTWEAFGSAVASAGDVNGDGTPDFIIGSTVYDNGAIINAGAARVYSGVDSSLLYEYIGASQAESLGRSVAGLGDVDLDGFDDFIISSPYSVDGGGILRGSATVYSGATGMPIYVIVNPSPDPPFARLVSAAGDVNGDGQPDFMIAVPEANPGGIHSAGSVFLYSGATGQVIYQIDGTEQTDYLGSGISEAGDIDGDGFDDFIIGSEGADSTLVRNSGVATVYSGFDLSILFQFSGEEVSQRMGSAVTGNQDVNGDGIPDFMIGASGWSRGFGNAQGSVYVFSGSSGERLFRFRGQSPVAMLGQVISFAGDLDRDGYADFFFGSPNNSSGGIEAGGLGTLFSGATGNLIHTFSGEIAFDRVGSSFASLGDIDGNGFSDFVLGINGVNQSTGAASVLSFDPYLTTSAYRLSRSTGGTVTINIDFPDAEANAQYGLLLSRTGAESSGFRGGTIPLVQDALFQQVAGGWTPPFMSNNFGTLDAYGNAAASFTLLPNSPLALIDTRRWFAAVTLVPGSGDMSTASIAVPLKIIP